MKKHIFLSILAPIYLFSSQNDISLDISNKLVKWNAISAERISNNSVIIEMPVKTHKGFGGGTSGISTKTYYVMATLERNCLARRGDVYFTKKDSMGDLVTAHSFNQTLISTMTDAQLEDFTKQDKDGNFVINPKKFQTYFAQDRLKEILIGVEDILPDLNVYSTECKNPSTGELLYRTDMKKNNSGYNLMEITFAKNLSPDAFPISQSNKDIEPIFSSVVAKKDNRLRINDGLWDIENAIKFCQNEGGIAYVDDKKVFTDTDSHGEFKSYITCLNMKHPFTMTRYEKDLIVTKDEAHSVSGKQLPALAVGGADLFSSQAMAAYSLPLGSTSASSNGNIQMTSTVYGVNGTSKYINIYVADGTNRSKNYKISNGNAVEITRNDFIAYGAKLPQVMVNAEASLISQCSAMGGSQMSVDNFTASCERQSAGSGCIANIIYTRGDQYAGKKSTACH